MACPDLEQLEQLAAVDDPAKVGNEVRQHVEFCRECEARVEELRANRRLVQELDEVLPAGGFAAVEAPPPDRIGGFHILKEIGRGGMGVVYEAEQQQPRRRVALKVVLGPSRINRETAKLFRRETQALARLRHPGIAAIHEAGATEDGEHFFAMELIEGASLSDYASEHGAALRQLLELFRQICDAVNYAHQRGVIHRDLKPSNILIDSDGRPKILDFGLARITDVDVAVTTMRTEVGKIQGTLPYMSPEQAQGDSNAIDLRSDVYALGVILYELATGQLPYDLGRMTIPRAVSVICNELPQRPSRINPSVPQDLETIIIKALEKEPQLRYQSVAALGEDVQRFLADQPILARSPSTIYQLRKLVARHKLPFALIAALFLLITAFAVSMGVLYAESQTNLARARRAEKDARNEAETSKQVTGYLVDAFGVSDPAEALGDTITARQILDRGAKRIAELEGQPVVQAELMHTIGTVFGKLGNYNRARELLEKSLELRRQELGEEHLDVAGTLINLAQVLTTTGDISGAESLQREALRIRQARLGGDDALIAEALSELGNSRYYATDLESAAVYYRQALDMQRRIYGEEHVDIAQSLHNLGLTLVDLGDVTEGESLLRDALAMYRNQLGEIHPDVANTLEVLAGVVRKRDLEEAEVLLREVLAMKRKLFDSDHPSVAATLNNLAVVLDERGEFDKAETMQREALSIRRARFGDDNKAVVESLNNLAQILRGSGEYVEAERLFRDALKICRARQGDYGWLPNVLHNLGDLLFALGRSRESEPFLREAVQLRPVGPGGVHGIAENTMMRLGIVLGELGKYDEAEHVLRDLLDKRIKVLGKEHKGVAYFQVYLARVLGEKGDNAEAETLLRNALKTRQEAYGAEHSRIAVPLGYLAGVLHNKGDRVAAEEFYRRAIAMLRKTLPADDPRIANSLIGLGELLAESEDSTTAEPLLNEALDILGNTVGDGHRNVARAMGKLGMLHCSNGALENGESLLRQAIDVFGTSLGDSHWRTAEARYELAGCFVLRCRYEDAERELLAAYQGLESGLGETHPRTVRAAKRLVDAYQEWEKPDRAAEWRGTAALGQDN